MIDFGAPGWLIGLGVIPLLWMIMRRSAISMTLWQRRAVFATRSAIVFCLVLALAEFEWRTIARDPAVLFLVDNSPSIQTDGLQQISDVLSEAVAGRPAGKSGVAVIAPKPEWVKRFDEPEMQPITLADARESRLTAALDWAALQLPQHAPGRIVVLTDGLIADDTAMRDAVARSWARGVPVDFVEVNPDRPPDAELASIDLPARLEPGRPFDLPVRIRSNLTATASLRVYQNEVLVRETPVNLTPGESETRIQSLMPDDGISHWRVELRTPGDTNPGNQSIRQSAAGSGRTRVLAVDPDPASLAAVVRAMEQSGMVVEARRPDGLPESAEALAGFDAMLLSDTPASALGSGRQQALLRWVSDFGGGLLVTGGSNGFSAGGYFGSPLASALPVRVDFDDAAELSTVALYVSLDRSGSMSATVAGTTKMALANAGAVSAMELLDSGDLFGAAAVDTEVHPVLALSRISDPAGAARILQSIPSGGGGIYVFTAMAAAYRELAAADAQVKHLILFSDAADAEEKSAPPGSGLMANALDVASAMLAARMTVSVVALGSESDRDTEFLRALASKGGGRFYLTSDATTLPQIFAEETLRATQNSLIEKPFQAVPIRDSPEISGVAWADAPDLLGYNAVLPRESVSPILATGDGTPLLAVWRRGLGQVGAFASDVNGRWSADWLDWDGFGQWLNQTVRALARSSESANVGVELEESVGRLHAIISVQDDNGDFVNGLKPGVAWIDGSSDSRSEVARQTGAGQYEAEFPLPPGGSGIVSVTVRDGGKPAFAAWSRPASGEAWVLKSGRPLIEAAAVAGGGRLNPSAKEIFSPDGRATPTRTGGFPILLALAIVLWPLDIWLRRRAWSLPDAVRKPS